ncbi:MAG: CBS domain-containing protein, partial [Candidatus Eremiobacterota bacterium]
EIVSVPPFRPRVHVARVPVAPPDLDSVEPIDPDLDRRGRAPERPVTVSSVMTRPVDCVHRGATVAEARQALENGHYHHAPVVDDQHRLVGVLSERDVLAAADQDPVTGVMSSPVLIAMPITPLYLACEALWLRRFSCLPVVDGNLRPVGILTAHDVLEYLVQHPGSPLWKLE